MLVVKVTNVPLCGGVPPDSMTCAMMLVVPLAGSTVASDVSVMVDPVGASSGTFSHATAIVADAASMAAKADRRRRRDIMKSITILIPMDLAGQAGQKCTGQRGYAMAALLVAMSVMAIMFTVVMPVWKQTARREKEEELVFRGRQYVHAIGLFQRKFANAFPPNIDVLVEQRFLRKKFKDPITARNPRAGSAARRARPVRPREARHPRRLQGSRRPDVLAGRRSARAVRRRAEFKESPARARINRFASITDAAITTSGPSCISSNSRPPVRAQLLGLVSPVPAVSAASQGSRPGRSRAASNLGSADAARLVPTVPAVPEVAALVASARSAAVQ
jgi:hypothetical protein